MNLKLNVKKPILGKIRDFLENYRFLLYILKKKCEILHEKCAGSENRAATEYFEGQNIFVPVAKVPLAGLPVAGPRCRTLYVEFRTKNDKELIFTLKLSVYAFTLDSKIDQF